MHFNSLRTLRDRENKEFFSNESTTHALKEIIKEGEGGGHKVDGRVLNKGEGIKWLGGC